MNVSARTPVYAPVYAPVCAPALIDDVAQQILEDIRSQSYASTIVLLVELRDLISQSIWDSGFNSLWFVSIPQGGVEVKIVRSSHHPLNVPDSLDILAERLVDNKLYIERSHCALMVRFP